MVEIAANQPDDQLAESITLQACQSCSRPFDTLADTGTQQDGSPSPDYCSCCLQAGQWTEPDIRMQELIDRCIDIWVKHHVAGRADANAHFARLFPTLKRWRALD